MEFSSKERYPSGSYGLISVLPIRTRRLSLRLFEPADADALYALHRDQRVARYAGGVKTKAESSESLKRVIDRTSSSGFGPLALEEKNSGAVIGWCGIQIMPGTDLYEVIYALQVAQWGKGLASEASTAIFCQAFRLKDPDIDEIFAMVYPQNVKSRFVLERLAMTFVKNRLDTISQRYASLYSVSRDTFLEQYGALSDPVA